MSRFGVAAAGWIVAGFATGSVVGLVASPPAAAQDAEKAKAGPFPSKALKEQADALVRFIDLLGRAETDKAIDVLDGLAPNGLGEQDRTKFQLMLGPFKRRPAAFESVDVLGLRRISTQTYAIHLLAHGRAGPVWFRFRVYRYDGEWRPLNVTFVSDWEKFSKIRDFTPFEEPLTYPLEPSSGDDVTLLQRP